MKKTLLIIAGLAFLGALISGYSFSHHIGFASGELCSPNDTFNCDVVNQGPYSEIGGVPVALIGIIGYIEDVKNAEYALKHIIAGSKHSAMYAWLEKKKAEEKFRL